jgi:CMP-N-acetylneuraminic acid synthetase
MNYITINKLNVNILKEENNVIHYTNSYSNAINIITKKDFLSLYQKLNNNIYEANILYIATNVTFKEDNVFFINHFGATQKMNQKNFLKLYLEI